MVIVQVLAALPSPDELAEWLLVREASPGDLRAPGVLFTSPCVRRRCCRRRRRRRR
jgi:hypothetical protein